MAVAVRLLGSFHIEVDGVPVPAEAWSRRQAAALVKLLALAPGRELHREQVIDALWPDLSLSEAAPRLHKAAHFARKVLGDPQSLVLRGEMVALHPGGQVQVDAHAFDAASQEALAAGTVPAAEGALSCYGGDLLPQDLYEPWTENTRERLRLRHLQLLRQAERWEQLLELDPADEDAHLCLMRAHARAGDRRAALRQFEHMERVLERELGVPPSQEAIRLRDELLGAGPAPAVPAETLPAATAGPAPVAAAPAPPAEDARPVSVATEPETRAAWPLTGRGAELELIAGRFGDRQRGGVLITGRAGVGKTRLAEECLHAARSAGLATARIAGHPETESVSLGALAHLVPPDIVTTSGGDTELDRATLFHRARSTITRSVPRGERLLVLVDDVDHLDELSRAVVASLVVDRSAFAVLTMRSAGQSVPSVEHLVKDGHIDRLELVELDVELAETLLYRVLGGPMLAASLGQLTGASLGNPGILRQLVETALDRGTLACSHGVWQLTGPLQTTPTLEGLVAERLAGLTGEARHVIELLAVAGELGLEVLVDLTGEAAVETVDGRGVLVLRDEGRRTNVGLAHPLYGEVVRGQLSGLAGRRLRRELADAVEARGARRRDDQFRIVAWRLDGGGHVDPALLVGAARLALLDGRLDIVARLLDRLDEEGQRSAEATMLRAEVHFRRGESERVDELLAPLDTPSLDDRQRAQVVRRRANNLFYVTTDHTGSVGLLAAALGDMTDPSSRGRVEASMAMILATGGQVARALELAEATLPGADEPVRLELLRALGIALPAAGRSTEAVERAREGRALHADLEEDLALPGATMLLFAEVVALTECGRIDEARRIAEHGRRQYQAPTVGWIITAQARLELLAGRTRSVRRILSPLIHEARVRDVFSTERWLLALHATARLLEGAVEQAREELDRVATLEDGTRGLFHPEIDRAHALLAAALGDLDGARSRLLASADDARERGAHGVEASLLHDIARLGGAADVSDRFLDVSTRVQGELAEARVLHVHGLLSADPDLTSKAAAQFADAGADLMGAEAAAAAARQLADQGRGAEAEAAAATAEELRSRSGVRLVTPALDGQRAAKSSPEAPSSIVSDTRW